MRCSVPRLLPSLTVLALALLGTTGTVRAQAPAAAQAAQAAQAAPGEARAQAQRGGLLGALQKPPEALAAWEATATAWHAAGDGPGEVEALCRQALLLRDLAAVDTRPRRPHAAPHPSPHHAHARRRLPV